jgi:hypothetical protein
VSATRPPVLEAALTGGLIVAGYITGVGATRLGYPLPFVRYGGLPPNAARELIIERLADAHVAAGQCFTVRADER